MWSYGPTTERFFTAEQLAQVEALFLAIFPGDDKSPSAKDARAADYLDHFLAIDEAAYYEIKGWKNLYPQALTALNAAAVAQFEGRTLAQLSTDEVTALLKQLAAGTLTGFPEGFDQKGFFTTLRGHCIEGCFGDSRWGGNQNTVIWRWYGYLQPATEFRRMPQTPQEVGRHEDK
jgi:hypothetical protein